MLIYVDLGAIWGAGSEPKSVKSEKSTDAELGDDLGQKPKSGGHHFWAARRNAQAAGEDFRRGTRSDPGQELGKGAGEGDKN